MSFRRWSPPKKTNIHWSHHLLTKFSYVLQIQFQDNSRIIGLKQKRQSKKNNERHMFLLNMLHSVHISCKKPASPAISSISQNKVPGVKPYGFKRPASCRSNFPEDPPVQGGFPGGEGVDGLHGTNEYLPTFIINLSQIKCGEIRVPSRGLTYPTLGKGKSSSKWHFWGTC